MIRPPAISLLFFAAPIAALAVGTARQQQGDGDEFKQTSLEEKRQRVVYDMMWKNGGAVTFNSGYDPVRPYVGAQLSKQHHQFDPQDEYSGMPRDNNVDLVVGLCSGCHSLQIVMQQSMTPARWDYTLDWMSEKQGMAPLSAQDREKVYAYLVANFSSGSK